MINFLFIFFGALILAFIPSLFIICFTKMWMDNTDNKISAMWNGITLSTIVWAFILIIFMR